MKNKKYELKKIRNRVLAGMLCGTLLFGQVGSVVSAAELPVAENKEIVTEQKEQQETQQEVVQPEVVPEDQSISKEETLSEEEITPEEEILPEEQPTPEEEALPEEQPTLQDEIEQEEPLEVKEQSASEEEQSLLAVDEEYPRVVYVGISHGADLESEPTGQMPEYPYPTLEEAYGAVENGGTIKIVDSLTVSQWPENANKKVIIEGWTGDIAGTSYNNPSILMDGNWILKADTTIQKLTLKQASPGIKIIYPEGHRIQIGSGELENPGVQTKEGRVAPRVTDTFIKDVNNGSGQWFTIGTDPADLNSNAHITKVDVHAYGGIPVSVVGDTRYLLTNDNSLVNTITTPNLETIEVELAGSTGKGNELKLPDRHWYNGVAPAFDGERLQNVNITLGYVSTRTYSMFRTGTDNSYKSTRKTGKFPINYTFDHFNEYITQNAGEAVALGEAFTTGDMTVDIWDSKFWGSQTSLTLCVFGGQYGNININLHNSDLKGIGNNWAKADARNGGLSFNKFVVTMDDSVIKEWSALQDNLQITMKGNSKIEKLRYFPNTTSKCDVINEGRAEIGRIERNPVNIVNQQGAELSILNTTDRIQDVKNQGTMYLKETQTWLGNYTGGSENAKAKLVLQTGVTLDIKGSVGGKTNARAEKTEGGSQIAAIFAGTGSKDSIVWENLEGSQVMEDGYWVNNLETQDYSQQDCVYVRYSGSDKNDGTSYIKAVKSFHKAYELASVEKKKIVVCDSYFFSDVCEEEHTESNEEPVVVTTTDGQTDFEETYDAKLLVPTSNVVNEYIKGMSLNHAFHFKNITITGTGQTSESEYMTVYANGHPTVMGEGVQFVPYTSVFGGSYKKDVRNTDLTIQDGTYFHIYGGNHGNKVAGEINLTVNQASFRIPHYSDENVMSIVGGSRSGTVEADITVNVAADENRSINNVNRIIGGNYTTQMTGNIELNVSGTVNFDSKTTIPGYLAIVGGNYIDAPVIGNIAVTVQNVTGTGTPYIIGGNGISRKVDGNVSLTVDGVHAYQIVGGCGWTRTGIAAGLGGSVTGDICMNIGQTAGVTADSIYGCGGNLNNGTPPTENMEYNPKSMTMNLKDVSASIVSGGVLGTKVSEDTRSVLSLNLQGENQIREITEFANTTLEANSTLIYDGTSLNSDELKNNGTIQYHGREVSVNSKYIAGENARNQLNAYTTVDYKKGVTGSTKVSSLSGKKTLTIRAMPEDGGEPLGENLFVGDGISLEYSTQEECSIWKFDPSNTNNLAVVYVNGVTGDDTWNGSQAEQGETIEGEAGGTITLGPVKTLERAYEMIKDGGSIIVSGKTEISRWPVIQKKALITSDASLVPDSNDKTDYRSGNTNDKGEENTGLFFQPGTGDKYLLLSGDVTLRHLDFQYKYEDLYGGIDADGNRLIIGDPSSITPETINPDVQFFKIQDQKRVSPDTFLLVGGGHFRKTLENIHLEVYNTEVKAVVGLFGGESENNQRTVEGSVQLVIQDCKTSKGLHYCTFHLAIDQTGGILYTGGYGTVKGDANVKISYTNSSRMPYSTDYVQLRGLKKVKNLGNGELYYLFEVRQSPEMNINFGMFHAAKKCNITYESNGTGRIHFSTFAPVDENSGKEEKENTEVEVTLLGNIKIDTSSVSIAPQSQKLSVVLNLGNEERGSEGIVFANASKQFETSMHQNVSHTEFQSYRINYYPGTDVKFDLKRLGLSYTTVKDGFPVVSMHSLQSASTNAEQTEYRLDAEDFIENAVLECNNSKVIRTVETADKRFDLTLVNGGSYEYVRDDFELNGSLTLENGTQLVTNGTVLIEKDLNLKENVSFPVENFLDVKGNIDSKENASLLVNNAATVTVGGAKGTTRVDFNGIAGENPKGHFTIQAVKGSGEGSSDLCAEERFQAGTDKNQKPITLQYDAADSSYVTWTYGQVNEGNEIFLNGSRGDDSNSGAQPAQAVETFQKALELAAKKAENLGLARTEIVISGRYKFKKDVDGQIPQATSRALTDVEIVITQKSDSLGSTYKSVVEVESGFEIPRSLTFENIRLSFLDANPEWYAGGHTLTIGEDVTVLANDRYPSIYGGHEYLDVTGNTDLKIYSGTWFRVYGGGKGGNVSGNTSVVLGDALLQSAPKITTDTEVNSFSTVTTNAVFGGGQSGLVNGKTQIQVNYGDQYGYIFGGGQNGTASSTEVSVDHNKVKIHRIYGGSYAGSVTNIAKVDFFSGSVNRIYGAGLDTKATTGSTKVTIGKAGKSMTSAQVKNYLRGSGDLGGVTGEAQLYIMDGATIAETCKVTAGGYTGGVGKSILYIKGGEILTDVYAGGAGEFKMSGGGLLDEIDPEKGVASATEVHISGGTVKGNVYGGGNLGAVGTENIQNADNPVITVADIAGGTIEGDFYGGGSLAPTYGNIQMTLNMSGESHIGGSAFGGGQGRVITGEKGGISADIHGTTIIDIQNAQVTGGIYGGCNLNGHVDKTRVNAKTLTSCGIYGGGLGADTYVENTAVDLELPNQASSEDVIEAKGSVYGGGDQGKTGKSTVYVKNWIGNVYGGGRGAAEEPGVVNAVKNFFRTIGNAGVELLTGFSPFAIDGLKDANTKETQVTIRGTLVGNAYGGGEMATVGTEGSTGTAEDRVVTSVIVEKDANVTGNLYGGGKGRENREFAKVYGNTNVMVNGGTVITSNENSEDGCIFGGGEIAPVDGNTNVTVGAGNVSNVFGGNDQSGTISGNTKVMVTGNDTSQPQVKNVYGGGRDAAYDGTGTQVIISDGTVENAYGGGFGTSAVCKITSLKITGGNVTTAFAGGNASTVSEKAKLLVNTSAEEEHVKTIFAGNNQADMEIQPTINLESGKIGTFYGGGNEGNMTAANGLTYAEGTFGSENISITTVYGGCNQANVDNGVTLQLIKGTYDTVYGGNNISGEVHRSHVVLNGPNLKVSAAYGGGNQADIENASVTALAGTIGTIYGGGNNATATESVSLAIGENTNGTILGAATITDVYSGNNQASMDIEPKIDFQKGTVTNFYGGGNEGTMEGKEGRKAALSYTLNSEQMNISNVYGGGNKADVKGTVTLQLAGAQVEKAYGGCNNSGQVEQTNVLVCGNGTNTVYGGGQGEATLVQSANVRIQNGEVQGNVYGGSGFGKVESAIVTVQEENPKAERIKIGGSVYGGGYGESSVVKDSHVIIDMALNIATTDDANADLIVKEASAETASDEKPSGETKTTRTWNTGKENTVSTIVGSVYGGGDMGKVGDGNINFSANTADITEPGSTDVQIKNGYIQSSVFGGGSGIPQEGQSYTPYMGTVFGSCQVNVEGGYVNVSIYGCGHQSRVYAAPDQKAAVVTIAEQSQPVVNLGDFAGSKEIVIGNSVFAGGNKGEGSNQNASVYTVIGDTEVNLKGIKDKAASTAIYFLSDSQGGVYGDGNLCLVNGTKTVNLIDFNYGTQKELLKTFYSLQRADVVNLENSRIVLNGAKDLVDESADDTVYAINRVGQLNMKKNSALKLTTIVNLLGGLSSDQNTDTVYIHKGNNGSNGYVTRGGRSPENALNADQMTEYRNAYLDYLGLTEGKPSNNYTSFNVISVANGSYLEIKKSDTEYGNVTGLFTLELLHANPGEGGGFVYAEIGNDQNPGSTGDFICTTKMEDKTDSNQYMEIKDTVGGYKTSDFTYYYWYIRGGKYSYKTNLKGYIGTADTEFDIAVNLTELEEGNHYILNSITGDAPVEELNSPNKFASSRFKDEWKNEWADDDYYAIEVKMVPGGGSSNSTGLREVSLGYLSYGAYGEDGKKCWGIKKDEMNVITGTGNENEANVDKLKENDVYGVQSGTTGLSLQFVLHKGSGVTVEFKDVNLKFTFDVFKAKDNGYETGQGTHLTVDTYTSITRLVPTQAAFISSGRLYAGVSSNIPVKITKNSAFTAQFITKFVPSAFNTNAQTIQETLTTRCDEIYLLDKETGVGFTVTEADNTLQLMHATEGNLSDYTLSKISDETYQVTYNKTSDENAAKTHVFTSDEVTDFRHQGMVLPKGTVITLVAQVDSHSPTYWYYHLTSNNVTEIPLSEFRRMGDVRNGNTGETYSFEKASNGSISPLSSNRVTENLVFVFDFSNVPDHQDTKFSWLDKDGNLMLKHKTTIGANQNVDIMDYVSGTSVVEDGVSETQYERVHPAISEAFRVSNDKSGISKFSVSMKDTKTYYTKDTYHIHIEIEEDKDYINTQYEEREYAVLLQQTDEQNIVIPFPEGTTFKYQGNNIIAGGQNQSVIIPVKKAGNHEVEIQTNLEGFDEGKVRLKATLYSSSVASYYNGLETRQEAEMEFEVEKQQEGALQIEKSNKQQSFTAGDVIELIIQFISNGEQSGTVGIYKYDRNSDSYKKIALPDVFQDAADSFGMDTIGKNWKATINSNAAPGTYRLEFQYGDKTEYWDFIIS